MSRPAPDEKGTAWSLSKGSAPLQALCISARSSSSTVSLRRATPTSKGTFPIAIVDADSIAASRDLDSSLRGRLANVQIVA
jgi:hypothetical protein